MALLDKKKNDDTSKKETKKEIKPKKDKIVKEQKVKTPKTTAPKEKKVKIDKDTLMNTPIEANDGVKVMPYDEETLTVFSLKKMNFKDMTGYQKNTFIIIGIFILCFILISSMSSIKSFFGGVTSGNLRLPWFNNSEEEEEEVKENIVASGNYIKIGGNDAIKIDNLKFNKFSKSSNDTIIYNYVSTEEISDIKGLNIFIEFYNNSRTLISRHRFNTEDNTLKANEIGINQVKLSSNNYNKAYYIKVRFISDAELETLPDIDNDSDTSGGSTGGNSSGGNGGNGGSSSDNIYGDDEQTPENETLTCYYSTSVKDLKITKSLTAEFENGKVTTYNVNHKIVSMTEVIASNYSTYYKKLLKVFKNILASPGCSGDLVNRALEAELSYNIVLKDYKDIEIIDGKKYDEEELKKYQTPYRLEIEKGSTREEAIEKLESTNEWVCD